MTGFSQQEILGRNCRFLQADDRDQDALNEVRQAIREVRDCCVLLRNYRKDGSLFWNELAVGPVRDESGKLVHFVGIQKDVTARIHADLEREELITELKGKNAELEQFAYAVSHDLRSPLVTIQGFLKPLQQSAAEGDIESHEADLDRIRRAVVRMAQLLNDVMELSRIGRVVNPQSDVSLGELAKQALESCRGTISTNVQIEIADDLPIVCCDRTRMLTVLQNLIENALKFTSDEPIPRVEVGVRRDNAEQVCFVRDNGIGIASDHRTRVFRLFEQLDKHVSGSGIGLALTKRIIEMHGGRIWVESEGSGRGSTLCFVLPSPNESTRKGDSTWH